MDRPTACFVGTRIEAFVALSRYADIKLIITTKDSRLRKHSNNNISLFEVSRNNKGEAFELISHQEVDIVLSAGFPYIIPAAILNYPRMFINSHPALLPSYKGFNAIKDAFNNNEAYMGVTVHEMVEEVDSGAVLHQEQVWVEHLAIEEIYQLLFSVVEPMAITKVLELVINEEMDA